MFPMSQVWMSTLFILDIDTLILGLATQTPAVSLLAVPALCMVFAVPAMAAGFHAWRVRTIRRRGFGQEQI